MQVFEVEDFVLAGQDVLGSTSNLLEILTKDL